MPSRLKTSTLFDRDESAQPFIGYQDFSRRARMRAALGAAWLRLPAPRLLALARAWRESDECDAAARPSRFNAPLTA
jgi:hypothetical protein